MSGQGHGVSMKERETGKEWEWVSKGVSKWVNAIYTQVFIFYA